VVLALVSFEEAWDKYDEALTAFHTEVLEEDGEPATTSYSTNPLNIP
jgi:hypothetical protein